MKTIIQPDIKGHVTAYLIKGDVKDKILDTPNALDSNFTNIIRNVLVGNVSYQLDRIAAKKATVELANTPRTSFVIDGMSSNVVKLNFTFDEASFDDTLDELNLYSDVGGQFSILTGLNITKDNLTKLQIEWKLIINNS